MTDRSHASVDTSSVLNDPKRTAEQPTGEPLLLRAEEVAKLLGISRSKAYSGLNSGLIPGRIKIDRALRCHRPTLLKWLADEASGGAQ